MKWSEVRTLHPNKFVLLEKLKEHIDGNYKYIDEVALIDVIDNINIMRNIFCNNI